MNILSRLLGRNKNQETRVGGTEDFMSLIRVYFQATMAAQLGITNLAVLPDLRIFKQTLKVPTVNNKLGVGERTRCRKMAADIYGLSEDFFRQIDNSIKHRCRTMQDVQPYFAQFQGFSQDLMMLMSNLMQWKFRLPSFMHKTLRNMTAKTTHDIMTRNDWSDAGVARTVQNIRQYSKTLMLDENWMTEYVHTVVMLAKKEPRPQSDETEK